VSESHGSGTPEATVDTCGHPAEDTGKQTKRLKKHVLILCGKKVHVVTTGKADS
jgi:hypothetical protein